MGALHQLVNFGSGLAAMLPQIVTLAALALIIGFLAARNFRFQRSTIRTDEHQRAERKLRACGVACTCFPVAPKSRTIRKLSGWKPTCWE
jgi:hypothetical protein